MNARDYIGRAKLAKNPYERAEILKQAAVDFARRANGTTNHRHKRELTAIGLEFAGAAQRIFEPPVPGMHHDSTTEFRALDALHSLYPEGLEHAIAGGEGASVQQAPRTSIQPATFTQETALGRYATVTNNPTPEQISRNVTQQSTVALWQGNKIEAQAMTVDVGTIFPPTPPPTKGVLARPFASIQYGADGNIQNLVTIDVGLGKRITVVGNYVSITVGMDPLPAGFDSVELTLGGSIGAFAAPTAAPIIRTVYADNIVPGATFGQSKLFNIPLRATRLFPPLLLVDDTITITFLNIVGTPISVWSCTYSPTTRFQQPVVVPGDAAFITVQTTQAANQFVRVPFELSL